MKDYSHLHEVETVRFRTQCPRPVGELVDLFCADGFTLHDDVLTLDRSDNCPPWQSSSIVQIEVWCRGKEVYGFDGGEWDELSLKYLFAYLPFECAERFFQTVEKASQVLGIDPERNGKPVCGTDLRAEFLRFREQLLVEVGYEPGSESAAIVIQCTYPRRG